MRTRIPESGATMMAGEATQVPAFDLEAVRAEFPALEQTVRGRRLAYLDSGASALRPLAMIHAVDRFHREYPANVHRGVHALAERATAEYEAAREEVARFLGAGSSREIVFVRGTTEAINLVASSFVRPRLGPGDEILVTGLEHHANLVPWQMLAAERGARVVVAPFDERGEVTAAVFAAAIGPRTRFAAVTHTSNALGTVLPLEQFARALAERGVPWLVDGAQAVPHAAVDVRALGADFFAFSGHKVFAPNGIGALWGRAERLAEMPPWQGGGDMIASVTYERSTFAEPPLRFEAGTPNVAGAIGLAASLRWLESLDRRGAEAHERAVFGRALAALRASPGVRVFGDPAERAPILPFAVEGAHPHDVATILDAEGVAVRAGHHCAQPVVERLGETATVRASFALYNGDDDVEALLRGLDRVRAIFGAARGRS